MNFSSIKKKTTTFAAVPYLSYNDALFGIVYGHVNAILIEDQGFFFSGGVDPKTDGAAMDW
ncbi:hypothetical protein RCO48_20270 [Peribacillus frigoritolerans]|nr:hypothetical protein [Peribacillus frigoritolerans]